MWWKMFRQKWNVQYINFFYSEFGSVITGKFKEKQLNFTVLQQVFKVYRMLYHGFASSCIQQGEVLNHWHCVALEKCARENINCYYIFFSFAKCVTGVKLRYIEKDVIRTVKFKNLYRITSQWFRVYMLRSAKSIVFLAFVDCKVTWIDGTKVHGRVRSWTKIEEYVKIAEMWNRNSSESGAKLVARRGGSGRLKRGEGSDHRGSLEIRCFNINSWLEKVADLDTWPWRWA